MNSSSTHERGTAWIVHPDPRVRDDASQVLAAEGFDVLASESPRGTIAALMLGRVDPPHVLLIGAGALRSIAAAILAVIYSREWPTHLVVVGDRAPWLSRVVESGADARLDPRFDPPTLRNVVGNLVPRPPSWKRRPRVAGALP